MTKFLPYALCLLLSININLFAQTVLLNSTQNADTVQGNALQEITIAAASKADSRSPFSFQNINSLQLKNLSVGQEPAFVLQQTPSVTAYSESGHSNGYAYMRLRGIDQTRLNVTLDGMPINESEDQGVYFANFPDFLNGMGNLQIQRGVGMSKNGTASYGGSLQFEPMALSDTLSLNMGMDFGSFYTYRIFGELQTGIKKNVGAYVRLSQQHSDGYKYHSANTGQSAFAHIGWANKKHALRLVALVGHQLNAGLSWLGATEQAIALDRQSNANAPTEIDDFMQALAQLQYRYFVNANMSLKAGYYGMYSNGNYFFDYNNFLGLPSTDELYNYDFRANMNGLFANLNYEKNKSSIAVGLNAHTYNRKHTGSEITLGKLYENTGTKNELSTFAKYSYRTQKWLLHSDLQYRYASFAYKGTAQMPDLSWHFFNPKVGISYQLKPNMTIYYSLGLMGREPTRNDMFYGNDDLPTDSLGAPLLGNTQAEYAADHELGWRAAGSKWHLNINAYYMQFRNEIVLNGQFGPNALALTDNVKRSFRSGLEWDSQIYLSKHWVINHSISYNYSQITAIDSSDIDFSPILTPAFIVNQTLFYKYNRVHIGLDMRYQSQSYLDFANAHTLPAFWTANLQASYRLRHWLLGARVNNLFNAKYYSNGAIDYNGIKRYFVQAPTHFTVSLQWQW